MSYDLKQRERLGGVWQFGQSVLPCVLDAGWYSLLRYALALSFLVFDDKIELYYHHG